MGKLTNPTVEGLQEYLKIANHFLIDDREKAGEGIVIKNYDFVNRYGRIVWAKMLTEDFSVSKGKIKSGQ